ncbi:MAG: hypothetical protein Q9179_007269 [Wetmoreana sp. 5 TL-2023]
MAILEDIEVRVVSTASNQPLHEYDNPKRSRATRACSIEKYIEAKAGTDFHIEIYFPENFNCWAAWGVFIGIKIDGGVVDYCKVFSKAEVEELKDSGEPVVLESVTHSEGSQQSEIGFRFGSLTINDNMTAYQAELRSQAARLGAITINIMRVNKIGGRPRHVSPEPLYNPLTTLNVPRELVDSCHVDTVMQPGEKKTVHQTPHGQEYTYTQYYGLVRPCHRLDFVFRYRSEMQLRRLGCIPRITTVDFSTEVERGRTNTPGPRTRRRGGSSPTIISLQSDDEDAASLVPITSSNRTEASKYSEDVVLSVVDLKRQFQEYRTEMENRLAAMEERSEAQRAATEQNIIEGLTDVVRMAFATRAAPAGITAAKARRQLQLPRAKRERAEEEDDMEVEGGPNALGSYTTKRTKTGRRAIVELDWFNG